MNRLPVNANGIVVDVTGLENQLTGIQSTLNDIDTDTSNLASDSTQINSAVTSKYITGINHGSKRITSAGTDEPLVNTPTLCKRIIIQAYLTNTGFIAVGSVGVDAANDGVLLTPGMALDFDIDDVADIYIDATVSNDGVRFTYFT